MQATRCHTGSVVDRKVSYGDDAVPLKRHRGIGLSTRTSHMSSVTVASFAVTMTLALSFGFSSLYRRTSDRVVEAGVGGGDTSSFSGAVTLGVIVHPDETSPLGGAAWKDVLEHMNTRLGWEDPGYSLRVYGVGEPIGAGEVDGIMALGIKNDDDASQVKAQTASYDSFIAVDSSDFLVDMNRIQGSDVSKKGRYPGLIEAVVDMVLPKQKDARAAVESIMELYGRKSSDDLFYSFLVFINVALQPVPAVQNSTKRSDAGLSELYCMVSKCGSEIFQCVTDPECKTALDCLNSCSFNDQVCSYRCIASYESVPLQEFSLCILQKHNCLGMDASIPSKPEPKPMAEFRGQKMTNALAQDLFVGWLDDAQSSLDLSEREVFSWRVFAGKNAAYDYFPCQFQLFYPGKAKNSFWYRPIFKVKTIDDRIVWRDRLYRVRPQDTPGTFRFSVLDNGVTSLEDWVILDCHEALEWCVFSYKGAAARAGLSYTGAILASRDGTWPSTSGDVERIQASLDKAGIKMWELSTADNSNCQDFSTSAL